MGVGVAGVDMRLRSVQLPEDLQGTLGRSEWSEAAALLLDEVVLDTAHGLGGFEDARPGRVAFTEEQAAFRLVARRVLEVVRLHASGVRLDEGHRIGAFTEAGAEVELEGET